MNRLYVFLLAILVVSCTESDPASPDPVATITRSNMHPDSAIGWLYYTFDGDSIIQPSQAGTTQWDVRMAFLPGAATRQIDVFLNSGTAGSGMVKGAMVASRFENLTVVPDENTLKTDDTTTAGRIVPANVIGGDIMFVYDVTSHTITPSPDKVLVIKSGKGEMVKFQFTSIYKDAVSNPDVTTPMGYYHFRYQKAQNGKW